MQSLARSEPHKEGRRADHKPRYLKKSGATGEVKHGRIPMFLPPPLRPG